MRGEEQQKYGRLYKRENRTGVFCFLGPLVIQGKLSGYLRVVPTRDLFAVPVLDNKGAPTLLYRVSRRRGQLVAPGSPKGL